MQEIRSYIYDNTLLVRYDPTNIFDKGNRQVYARTIDVYKGVDNPFKVKVLNDHQKPTNVTGKKLIFTIIDHYVKNSPEVVLTSEITLTDAEKGQGELTLTRSDLNILDRNQYTWAIKISNNDAQTEFSPTYVNDNWLSGGQLQVNEYVFPVSEPAVLDLGLIDDTVQSAIYDFGQIR